MWIYNVVEMLLPLHLAYTSEFSGSQQTACWLAEKPSAHKTNLSLIRKID
jgi:hypothetical protein